MSTFRLRPSASRRKTTSDLKIATLCEVFGLKTAFQEGGENDPVNQLAAYHVDISTPAFGIQEENHFRSEDRHSLRGLRPENRFPGGRRERPGQPVSRVSCRHFDSGLRHPGGKPLPI